MKRKQIRHRSDCTLVSKSEHMQLGECAPLRDLDSSNYCTNRVGLQTLSNLLAFPAPPLKKKESCSVSLLLHVCLILAGRHSGV